jgi:hypothetical protein
MKEASVSITFGDAFSVRESFALNELRDSLTDSGILSEPVLKRSEPGVKDAGLTLGLTIAGLALSAIGNLVSAIALWGSKKNYSITFKSGNTAFSANNLSAREASDIARKLKDQAVSSDIKILVSHK